MTIISYVICRTRPSLWRGNAVGSTEQIDVHADDFNALIDPAESLIID